MTSSHLAGLTWPEVDALDPTPLLLVPLGSTEQHGPHLPLDTDTRIATAVAARVGAGRPGVVVAPALPVGSSGEHAGFPGTLSIGQAALELVVVELCRSADHFRGVVLVCGHGGNAAALDRAAATLRSEGRSVRAWYPRITGGDHHAGRTETSMMLALDPGSVRLDRAETGSTAPLAEVIGEIRRGGVISVAANGVLGDPAGASAEEGGRLLAGLVADLERVVAELTTP